MSAATKIIAGVGLVTVGAVLLSTGYGAGFGMPLIMGGITTASGGIVEALTPVPRVGGGSARGPDVNIQQTIPPELIVYGEAPIPGTPVFVGRHSVTQSGPDDEYSHWVYVHTRRRPMNALTGLIIGGKPCDLVLNGGTNNKFPADALIPAGGKYKDVIAVWYKQGDVGDPPFQFLLDSVPNNWTSEHKLTSISATYIAYLFDPQVMPDGPPEVVFKWQGFLVADPRRPSAGPTYSDNAALCTADALYGPHAGDQAVDPSLIDANELIAAANACDEQLTTITGDVIPRYRIGGFALATSDYDQILKDMQAAFGGSIVRVGASIKIYAAVPRPAEMDLTEDDLSSGMGIQVLRDRNALYNEIHAIFPNADANYNDAQSPTYPIFSEYWSGDFSGGGGGGPGSGSIFDELSRPVRAFPATPSTIAAVLTSGLRPGDWVVLSGGGYGDLTIPASVNGTGSDPIVFVAGAYDAPSGKITETLLGASIGGDITINGTHIIVRGLNLPSGSGSIFLSGIGSKTSRCAVNSPPPLQDGVHVTAANCEVHRTVVVNPASVGIWVAGAAATDCVLDGVYVHGHASGGRASSNVAILFGDTPVAKKDTNLKTILRNSLVELYPFKDCIEVKTKNARVINCCVRGTGNGEEINIRHGAGSAILGCYLDNADVKLADADTVAARCAFVGTGSVNVAAGNLSPAAFFAGGGGGGNYPYSLRGRVVECDGPILLGWQTPDGTGITLPPLNTTIEGPHGTITKQSGLSPAVKFTLVPVTTWTEFAPNAAASLSATAVGPSSGYKAGSTLLQSFGNGNNWPLEGLFDLGPDYRAGFYIHKNTGNNSTLAQLTSGLSLKGGSMGDEAQHGLAAFSRVWLDGDFRVTFKTIKTSGRTPPTSQGRMCYRFYMAMRGTDKPLNLSLWPATTQPDPDFYASHAEGVFFRMYNMETGNVDQFDPPYANIIDGSGSVTACPITGPGGNIDYQVNNNITWDFKRVGDVLTVTLTSDNQSTISWDIDITGAPSRGGFGFQTDPGLAVAASSFQVVSGSVVSPGALLTLPGSWPSNAFTYAFPAAGFSGWRSTSDAAITSPLAATFVPAPAAMADGFRAAMAQIASDTGCTFTEVAATGAKILIAASPGLSALGFAAYTFRPPSGAVFVDQGHSDDDFSPGSYMFDLALREISAAVGIVPPPSGSVVDAYSNTIMVRDASNAAPWATALRQMDKDAYGIEYNQDIPVSHPENPTGPRGKINPYREDDGGQQLIKEVRQPFCPYSNQVQRLNKIAFMYHRNQITWGADFLYSSAWQAHPIMVIAFSDQLTGWSAKKFQIGRYKANDNIVTLALVEYGDDIFAWTPDEEQLESFDDLVDIGGTLILLDDDYVIQRDTVLQFSPLDNDVSGDQETIQSIDTPSNGTISVSDNGRDVTYTPNAGWTGVEVLQYTATDGDNTGYATITIEVIADNVARAADDFVRVPGNTVVDCHVLANDHPTASSKTVTAVTAASHGTSAIKSGGGDATYKRSAGYEGVDSFTYTMTCAEGTDTATVNLRVGKTGSQGGQNSLLLWGSGVTGPGDSDAVGAYAQGVATARGRDLDIANIRMDRFSTESALIGKAHAKSGTYATAASKNMRIEQVMPCFTSQFSKGSHPTLFAAAAAGAFDATHHTIATILNGYDRIANTVIRLGHETGSGSQADAYVNDPSPGGRDYIAMWRRIAMIYKNNMDGVLIEWNNIQSPPDPRPFYPGDDVVDIIGVDAYGQVTDVKKLIVTDADWLAYANNTSAGGAPQGPRAWFLYAQSKNKLFSVAEWGVSPKKTGGGLSAADSPRYIRGMFELFTEASLAGLMDYECYFDVADGTIDHRIVVSGNPNPKATAEYISLYTP